MSVAVDERPARAFTGNGGLPARRAVIRWAWRLLRREWRQQLLILSLVTVAVAATFVGSTVATNAQEPAGAGFGTALDMATFKDASPQTIAEIATLAHRFGAVDVVENQTLSVPGSVATFSLRAQNPNGAYGQPMLSLASGSYPHGAGEVALTSGLASELHLAVGDTWHAGGQARRVVGIVSNPQNLLDDFALVAPGQVTTPTQVVVLFDAPGVDPTTLGKNVALRTVAQPERDQPCDHLDRRHHARDAARRPGLRRRVHRPRPAEAARDRHARRAGSHRHATSGSSSPRTASPPASSAQRPGSSSACSSGSPTDHAHRPARTTSSAPSSCPGG